VDVEKEDDLEKDLKGQLFTNNKTGGHSRDSDWKVADARKRHCMDLFAERSGKEEGGLVVYTTMRCVGGSSDGGGRDRSVIRTEWRVRVGWC
jgi:hypothetical protein